MANELSKFDQEQRDGDISDDNPNLIYDKKVERKSDDDKFVVEKVNEDFRTESSSSFGNFEETTGEKRIGVNDAREISKRNKNIKSWKLLSS